MKKILIPSIALCGAIFVAGCSTEVTPTDVKAIQAEAAKDVPKGLETMPVEKATEGLLNPGAGGTMSGGKKDNTKR
jgi:hypothetical protein